MKDYYRKAFVININNIKEYLSAWILDMTLPQLKKIMQVADKLGIEDYGTKSAVDVLYEVACRLSVLEEDIVSPSLILDKIDKYLESN